MWIRIRMDLHDFSNLDPSDTDPDPDSLMQIWDGKKSDARWKKVRSGIWINIPDPQHCWIRIRIHICIK